MFKIDKGVPLPKRQVKGTTKYPWPALKVGESFLIPGGSLTNLRSSCSAAGKRYNMKFTARLVDGGVRIWRVK